MVRYCGELNEIAVGNARLLSETKEGEVFFDRLTKVVPKQQAEVDGLRQLIEWFNRIHPASTTGVDLA